MNPNAMTAAHRSLPFGTKLRVTHGGRSVVVTINDRGPFVRGRVLDLSTGAARAREFERLLGAAKFAARLGLVVNAGHGLNYHNVEPIAAIPEIVELNIGHAIVARAVFDGLAKAVRDMKEMMRAARA